jgi:hypothetical protein
VPRPLACRDGAGVAKAARNEASGGKPSGNGLVAASISRRLNRRTNAVPRSRSASGAVTTAFGAVVAVRPREVVLHGAAQHGVRQ